MIKTVSKLPDGKTLVVLGLSDGNVDRLKQDEPIAFDLQSLGLPVSKQVAIAFKREDGFAGLPADFSGIALCFSTAALEAMKTWPNVLEVGDYRFTVFRGTDEQTMERDMRGLIGPETTVQHQGFAPSDIPPSVN